MRALAPGLFACVLGLACSSPAPSRVEPARLLAPARVGSVAPATSASPTAATADAGAPPEAAESLRHPDPPGLVRIGFALGDERGESADPDAAIDVACGAYRVQQASRSAPLFVRKDGHQVVREALPQPVGMQSLSPLFCFDLTADGHPELVYEIFTGGAHCCRVERVLSLGATVQYVLRWDAGEGLFVEPRQLDDTAAWELYGLDLTLMNWNSPVSAPSLPIVFALERGAYRRATRRFPDLIRQDRAHMLAREDFSGFERASYLVGSSVLLGDWSTVKPEAHALVDSSTDAKALTQQLDRIHARLAREL